MATTTTPSHLTIFFGFLYRASKLINKLVRIYALMILLLVLVFAFFKAALVISGTTAFNDLLPTESHPGFSAMQEILSTWKVLRNLGYFFVVIVALVQVIILTSTTDKVMNQSVLKEGLLDTLKNFLWLTFSYAAAGLALDMVMLAYFISLR